MTPAFIIGILAALFLVTEYILAFGLTSTDKDIAVIFAGLLGSILTMIGVIVNNIWGSSRSSEQKNETISKLLAENQDLKKTLEPKKEEKNEQSP